METNKEIVQKINQAFRDNDMEAFISYCTDDVTWTMIGNVTVNGKQGILDFMKGTPIGSEPILNELLIISGDNNVACTGTMEMPCPDGSLYKGAFCDVYKFADGKVKTLDSYIIEFK